MMEMVITNYIELTGFSPSLLAVLLKHSQTKQLAVGNCPSLLSHGELFPTVFY